LQRPFAIWTDTPKLHLSRGYVKRVLRARWLRSVFHYANYVMGTGTPALALLEAMGCPRERLVTFPFVVDLKHFSPSESTENTPNGRTVIVSSGRLVNWHKGYDVALSALGLLKKQGINNFVYRIAGVGPDKEALEQQATELDIRSHLEFVGWLETSVLPEFYRSANIFLHPSRFDPYPNAVLEAMACGLPVVGSTGAGSVVDRVRHTENGLITPMEDVTTLAECLAFALSHPDECRQMGIAARQTAEQWPVSRAIQSVKTMLYNAQGRSYERGVV
jgi:glycosyltransferase involved in cell wall biosynthesis